MLRRALVLSVLLLLLHFSAGQEIKKWPIPAKDAQAKIEKLLEEIYDQDLKKAANNPSVGARLAQTMLFEGKETKDDAAGRYVLLMNAHNLAALAGDVNTALAAADELAQGFAIPVATIFGMKIKMLQKASNVEGAAPDAYQAVIDRALMILDDTLDADDFPSSLDLIGAAEQAARKMKSVPAVVSMRRKQDEVVKQQKEFARWQPFADRLIKNPDDGEATLEMGKYHAFIKGNWDRGLPLLVKSRDGEMQSVANADLAATKSDSGHYAVAMRWYALGKKLDPATRTQVQLRAYYWFQQSFATATEKTRPQIDAKLQELAAALPPELRVGEITTEVKRIDIPSGPVYGCALTPDAKRFLATGYDGVVRVFNAKSYKEVRLLEGHQGKSWTVAVASDGQRAASGGFDGTVRLWDLAAGRPIKSFEGHKDYVRSVAISNDGQWVLSGGDDRSLRLWNVAAGKEERSMFGHDHTVWGVAISRDGKRGLSASLDKTARLWDLDKGETIKKLEGHTDTVLCVAFLPDGQHAVTGSTDKTLRVWNLTTGNTVQLMEGGAGYIQAIAVSPDGRRILSAGSDNVVRLWDAQSGKEIRKLEGHRDQVWHVAFVRDGRHAISSGQDGSVRLWK